MEVWVAKVLSNHWFKLTQKFTKASINLELEDELDVDLDLL